MRPGEDAEEVAAVRVVPRRTEARDQDAARSEQVEHVCEGFRGIGEVFERVERHDDIGRLFASSRELDLLRQASIFRATLCFPEVFLIDIDADDASGTPTRQFNRLVAVAATEIDDDFTAYGLEQISKQNVELAPPAILLIRRAAQVRRARRSEPAQQLVLERCDHGLAAVQESRLVR